MLHIPEGPTLDETMLEIAEAKEREDLVDLVDGSELRRQIERLIGRQPVGRTLFLDFTRGRVSGLQAVLSMLDDASRDG